MGRGASFLTARGASLRSAVLHRSIWQLFSEFVPAMGGRDKAPELNSLTSPRARASPRVEQGPLLRERRGGAHSNKQGCAGASWLQRWQAATSQQAIPPGTPPRSRSWMASLRRGLARALVTAGVAARPLADPLPLTPVLQPAKALRLRESLSAVHRPRAPRLLPSQH